MPHKAQLAWTPPSGGDAPTSYNVKRGGTPGSETPLASVPASQPNYEDDTVQGGQSYSYVVTAANADGESAASNEVSVQVPLAPPAAPSSLTVTAS